ncbi:MAG: sirohydrochlorin cobaltochelatase [Desulfovibrio aminophilus]|jgi:sirohydrochlorin cobaltochelatase|uniref:sirohydrochlorin cobaltochelatase n=1 Tax=Desulfovibrio aminophilus TaxID=81425 RepID=UPI00042862B4|nr:sirohydrochlorin cobaltochelatase [Desulfovibrio aminophilus]MDY0304918.1 sirohydrochlorin cobaltochelatase [Desulfovibrionaceae bacterium]
MSLAILLAAYGSRQAGARAAVERLRERVRAAYPDTVCAVAYTSRAVRHHLNRNGETADSVPAALDKLKGQGFRRVALLSLHIVPGEEYSGMTEAAAASDLRVELSGPLMADERDVERVADILAARFPSDGGEAVLFMGHGGAHPGNALYLRLDEALRRRDPGLHLGLLESEPGIEVLRDRLLAQGTRSVLLLPFLFGAGYHATQDLAGDGPDSWRGRLTQAGLNCRVELKGAGDYPELVDLWLAHLRRAVDRLAA